jgi:hypothetical protein
VVELVAEVAEGEEGEEVADLEVVKMVDYPLLVVCEKLMM